MDTASDDQADGLRIHGDQFLELFRTTGDSDDIDRAITAYEQAAACLSPDDPRLRSLLHKIGVGHHERYTKFGQGG
jgi:hypothetical protein